MIFSLLPSLNSAILGTVPSASALLLLWMDLSSTLSDGKVTVCYRGISSSISNDQLFESSGAGLFLQALETITSMQGLSSQTEDGILTLSLPGSEEDPAFSAKLNPIDAELLEISFPQENFKVVVSDFSPSNAN